MPMPGPPACLPTYRPSRLPARRPAQPWVHPATHPTADSQRVGGHLVPQRVGGHTCRAHTFYPPHTAPSCHPVVVPHTAPSCHPVVVPHAAPSCHPVVVPHTPSRRHGQMKGGWVRRSPPRPPPRRPLTWADERQVGDELSRKSAQRRLKPIMNAVAHNLRKGGGQAYVRRVGLGV